MKALRLVVVVTVVALLIAAAGMFTSAVYTTLSGLAAGSNGGVLQVGENLGAIGHGDMGQIEQTYGNSALVYYSQMPESPASPWAAFTTHEYAVALIGTILFLPFSAWLLHKMMGNPATWGRRPPD